MKTKSCLQCKISFAIKDYRAKFCSRSCAATYSNTISPKRKTINITNCSICKCEIVLKKKVSGGYYDRLFCDTCLKIGKFPPEEATENQTKESLYSKRKNWQSANSTIRVNARKVYFASNKPNKCLVCNYDKHIEVCHIKAVKDFANDVKISIINDITNLIGLCPTHHWELDNQILQLETNVW